MFKEIDNKNCKKCGLYKNQLPLYDSSSLFDVMFVGLSAKQTTDDGIPLDEDTNTCKIIKMIQDSSPGVKFYKTNLVKCLQLSNNQKIRYPSNTEINLCA